MDGMVKMRNIMTGLREKPLNNIVGKKVESITDYSLGVNDLPKSNVLVYNGADFVVIVRPSGTEPKIKIYLMASGTTKADSELLLNQLLTFASGLYE